MQITIHECDYCHKRVEIDHRLPAGWKTLSFYTGGLAGYEKHACNDCQDTLNLYRLQKEEQEFNNKETRAQRDKAEAIDAMYASQMAQRVQELPVTNSKGGDRVITPADTEALRKESKQ